MPHEIHSITDFRIVAPYTLQLTFEDGASQTIDFQPILRGELYSPLRDLDFFNQVRLDKEAGTIVWPNEADFDPATLHDWDQVGAEFIETASKWEEKPQAAYETASPDDTQSAAHSLMEAKARLHFDVRKESNEMSLAEVLPSAQQLSRRDKVRLARIMLEEVDVITDELDETNDIAPFERKKVYHIYTPYSMYGVAHLLMEAFENTKIDEEPAD